MCCHGVAAGSCVFFLYFSFSSGRSFVAKGLVRVEHGFGRDRDWRACLVVFEHDLGCNSAAAHEGFACRVKVEVDVMIGTFREFEESAGDP